MIADILFLVGLALVVLGLVKRSERWGLPAAAVGALLAIVVLVVAGPEMLDSFARGFEAGSGVYEGPPRQ